MNYSIEPATWPDDRESLRQVRETVFVHEQGVPPEMEWDDHDETALHLLARDEQGDAIATGRLLADGHIGRVAVLPDWRGQGVGTALLEALMQAARDRGLTRVSLNAQCTAVDFYARLGFLAEGPVFDDAGIPHRHMSKTLSHA